MSKKSSKRQRQAKRKKKKEQSAHKAKSFSRRSMADLVTRLGLMDTFTQLPRKFQNKLLSGRNPSLKIVMAEDSEEELDLESFRVYMKKSLRATSIQLSNWPFEISLYDCYRNVMPLALFCGVMTMPPNCDKEDQPVFVDAAKHFFDDINGMFGEIFEAIEETCRMPCCMSTRFDRRIITWNMYKTYAQPPKYPLTVSFRVTKPRVKYVKVDGKRRKACQTCLPLGGHKIFWHEWEESVLGLSSSGRLPVYVQSHAVDRLCSRLKTNSEIEYALFVLLNSIGSPNVVQKRSGVTWLEARTSFERRIGYFLVVPAEGVALVKTFLFLTMEGTPESELLYRENRLQRCDINRLDLDKLATFMRPDMVKDEEIAEIFKECGCGQLLELHKEFLFADEPDRGDAKAIKAYLDPVLGALGRQRRESPLSRGASN